MIIGEGLPFIKDYVSAINGALKQHHPEKSLTRIQTYWLSFVILGLLITNIEAIVSSENPRAVFDGCVDKISDLFQLQSSIKHMRHIDMDFCTKNDSFRPQPS
jgi:hypothetical protein